MDQQTPSLNTSDILIVDDQPANLRLLSRLLTRKGFEVRQAINGTMALQAVQAKLPQLIMLDIMMPDLDGYEVCSRLKADPKTADVPIIFLSALDDVFDKVKAFTVGAVDYISKPFQSQEVLARVQHHLALQAMNQSISKLNTELEQQVKERTQELEEVHAQLTTLAFHDELTGLPNRALFINSLNEALKNNQADSSDQFALLYIDCDRFKVVNDSLGHSVGDRLLTAVAHRLSNALPQVNILARLGGDEFAIILTNIQEIKPAVEVAEKVIETLSTPFKLEKYDVYVNASIGIALSNSSYTQPQQILRDADAAMYRAKKQGNRYQVFDPTMHQKAVQTFQIETDLRKAISLNEFRLNYQPIIDLKTNKLIGFETLVRWFHTNRGLISPIEFIPVAEETGLIIPIGYWILEEACQQLKTWQNQGLADEELTININLSARQFSQIDLIDQIDKILKKIDLDSRSIKFEITESAIMENQQKAQNILEQIRDRDIQICLDDFGTGYSSLSYLDCFSIDTLKIDKSFTGRLDGTFEKRGLVPVIINIAHHMGMNVVAEGVETEEQLNQLKELDCDFGQGYFFAKPLDKENATKLLESSPQW
ncbi:diguanylate cyclase domain protein [Lyngbya aestuarii BL J]|uniref:Diguanylate cyclase domain protein n=1 Tax=Lyngbya aestuarii BL J TaxID=1348334 RepID=U7QNW5_9CYAN|nr:GGDEF domain-containing response regulator [Lyngbya aestuarii]ERT09674.1 diguanylate cyclase domain protein [Lyngbya aestuarii BL J]